MTLQSDFLNINITKKDHNFNENGLIKPFFIVFLRRY